MSDKHNIVAEADPVDRIAVYALREAPATLTGEEMIAQNAYRPWPARITSIIELTENEKLFELPDGVLVFSIDPEADIDIQLEPQSEAPAFTIDDLEWVGDKLDGSDLAGSVWVARGNELSIFPQPIRHAADTLVRDLAQAFGLQIVDAHLTPADLENAEIFHVSDEFGIIGWEGEGGPVTDKMVQSFDKLWSLK